MTERSGRASNATGVTSGASGTRLHCGPRRTVLGAVGRGWLRRSIELHKEGNMRSKLFRLIKKRLQAAHTDPLVLSDIA